MKRKEKKKRKLKVIGYWLLAIGFLFVTGWGFRVVGRLKEAVWSGEGRVNWVMVGEDIFLVSLEPKEKSLVVLEIPKDTEIEVTRGFGCYRIGAVYELGKLEGMNGELLRESAQEYFGIPVDGYIRILDAKYYILNTKSAFLKILTNLLIKRKGQTNFSKGDIFRLWWETRKALPSQIKFIQLEDIRALKSKILIDGSKVWEIDQGRLDKFFQDNFYEPEIHQENLTVRTINATDHSGLAAHVARIISNMGGRVIEISNFKFQMTNQFQISNDRCEIRCKKEDQEKFTARRLQKVLGCEFVEDEDSDGRAEVTILAGEEYWQMLHEPFVD